MCVCVCVCVCVLVNDHYHLMPLEVAILSDGVLVAFMPIALFTPAQQDNGYIDSIAADGIQIVPSISRYQLIVGMTTHLKGL